MNKGTVSIQMMIPSWNIQYHPIDCPRRRSTGPPHSVDRYATWNLLNGIPTDFGSRSSFDANPIERKPVNTKSTAIAITPTITVISQPRCGLAMRCRGCEFASKVTKLVDTIPDGGEMG